MTLGMLTPWIVNAILVIYINYNIGKYNLKAEKWDGLEYIFSGFFNWYGTAYIIVSNFEELTTFGPRIKKPKAKKPKAKKEPEREML